MQEADIVFHDALVSNGILDLIPDGTAKQSVGKRAGRHSVPQPLICDLIVNAAKEGKRVLRLKGGDPSIFGRSEEEVTACQNHDIRVQVCAGVTTASAAAGSLTASLTKRGLARRLTFVTAHTKAGAVPELDWAALADPQATIAVYMGKSSAAHISKGLIEAGLSRSTPVVMIENVSLSQERHYPTNLELLPIIAQTAMSDGPALILIGEAVGGLSSKSALGRSDASALSFASAAS